MTPISLDYNATTPIDPAVVEAMVGRGAGRLSVGRFSTEAEIDWVSELLVTRSTRPS